LQTALLAGLRSIGTLFLRIPWTVFFAIGEQPQREMEQFLASATESDLDEVRPFGFRGYEATRRDMITQALLHAIQHRAQLATFLRQHGYKDQWVHDYIATRCK